ncbi:MAG TPA: hypothetical protein VM935_08625 [Chitinophagaceae bacterium]|jgi:hypothetical protein|nr:hypothetical protein [Chitinophagaceae bacterium]
MDRKDVLLFVPSGYSQEQVQLESKGGIKQFYQYNHGAQVYISYRAAWPSSNHQFMAGDTVKVVEANGGFMYSGRDESGLYWKEVSVDSLKWGYSFVPVNLLARYEQFVNTVRIKNKGDRHIEKN